MSRKLADHYHVLTGLPGYMPNSNYPCETLKEAGDVAYATADTFRDDGHKVIGNKRDGYEVLRRGLWHDGVDGLGTGYRWEVWQTITISPCDESDCRCSKCGTLVGLYDDCPNCGWTGLEGESNMG